VAYEPRFFIGVSRICCWELLIQIYKFRIKVKRGGGEFPPLKN
jgi:hypothetical protein